MDFMDVLRVLRRRWLVVLLGGVLTCGAGALAITSVQTNYQAQAQYVLLLPSGSTGVKSPTNPYLNMSSGQVFVATLIASDFNTLDAQRSLVEGGYDSDYSIKQGVSGGPLLDVLVNGTDRANVIDTRDELLERFDERLSALQSFQGIPDNQLMFSFTNAVDPIAEAVPGAKRKALILVAAVGLIATLILTFAVEGLLRRRAAAASQ